MAVVERRAHSLATLLEQVNEAAPGRKKGSDGWIGDKAHRGRKSDHNPNKKGVVQAQDITHDIEDIDGIIDPDDFHSWKFADMLLRLQDPRLKYIISHKRIGSGPTGTQPGKWRKYDGSNAHSHHVHISVVDDEDLYDDPRPWAVDWESEPRTPPPVVPPPPGITDEVKRDMMLWILNAEKRIDAQGNIALHRTSGGAEIGGVTQKDHPQAFAELHRLMLAGDQAGLKEALIQFALRYTNPAFGWHTDAGVCFYLADCIFNRGQTGGPIILQMAVGYDYPKDPNNLGPNDADGKIGPATRDRIEDVEPAMLIEKLRAARENYEDCKYGARPSLRRGLFNRWNNALAKARELHVQGGRLDRGTRWLQESLNKLGATPPLAVDGSLGEETKRILAVYQTERGLNPDGLPDEETAGYIERDLAKLVEALPVPSGPVAPAPPNLPDIVPPPPLVPEQELRLGREVLKVFGNLFGRRN